MPTIVEVNGQEIEFPDSMSQADIKDVLDRKFSSQQANNIPADLPSFFESEIDVINTDDAEKEPRTLPETLKGLSEAAETVAGGATFGAFGFAGGVIEGILNEITTGGFSTDVAKQAEASDRIEQLAMKRSSEFTRPFMPETEAGKDFVNKIGDLASKIPAVPPMVAEAAIISQAAKASLPILKSKFARNIRLIDEQTGLPSKELQAALKKQDVDFSLVMDDVENLPVISGNADDAVNSIVRSKIKAGSGNKSLATKRLINNSVVDDDLGAEAIRQGFRPGDVASAKNANIQTRSKMSEMLDMKRKIEGDSSMALDFRPSDIVGDEVMSRFEFIKEKALNLRNDLNSIAEGTHDTKSLPGPGVKGGLKGLSVDTFSIEKSVIDGLKKINIEIPDDVLTDTTKLKDFLKSKDAFIRSDISKDRTSQKIIRDTIDLLSEPGEADALRAHRVKRQIDTMVDFRKKSPGGLTDSGQNFAKSIRRSLNQSIRDVSKSYAKVNDDLSKAIESMNSLKDSLPRKVDLYSDNASAAVGQDLRKLLSNYSSRQDLRNSIKSLDETSEYFNGVFDTDVKKLVQFNNTLDDRFQATARGSFKGDIESAIRSSTLNPKELAKQVALDKVLGAIDDFRGVTDDKAFNTMQELLKRNK